MSRPHRARLTASRLTLAPGLASALSLAQARTAGPATRTITSPASPNVGALPVWLHMPMPERNPAPPPLPPPPPPPQGPEPDAPEVIDPPLPGERAPQIEPDWSVPMQSGGGIGWHHPSAASTC